MLNEVPPISSIQDLEKTLDYNFQNKNLLIQALTHTSFTHESAGRLSPSYERLEFLGDSVINLIITSILYEKYPEFSEGELSKLRGALVNEKIFSELGAVINLSQNIFIGKGEWIQKGQDRPSLIADTFEAVLGAIYLDGGLAQVEKSFMQILNLYKVDTKKDFFSSLVLADFDSKTQLQELCMSLYQEHPRYLSKEIAGGFLVSIWLKEKCLIESEGISKKKLEKELAKIVLTEKKYKL
jgi:ribonuclease-3